MFFKALGHYFAGASQKEELDALNRKKKEHYSRMKRKNRINKITSDTVRRQGMYAKLRAKSGETRHLMAWGLEIATAMHAAYGTDHSALVLQCVSSLMDVYMCMGVAQYPEDQAQEAREKPVVASNELSKEAKRTCNKVWWQKPKVHIFLEDACFQVHFLRGPVPFWNYTDDDFVGRVARIGSTRGGKESRFGTIADLRSHRDHGIQVILFVQRNFVS